MYEIVEEHHTMPGAHYGSVGSGYSAERYFPPVDFHYAIRHSGTGRVVFRAETLQWAETLLGRLSGRSKIKAAA